MRHLLRVVALLLPMFWAWSADGRGAVPLPKPRPADAPGVQDSRGRQPEKNNLPASGRPAAEPDSADETAGDQKVDGKAAEAKAPPQSACRLALTDAIAIAPSIPPIHGPGACGGEDLVRLEAVVLLTGKRVPMKPAAILRCPMASAIADWVRSDMAALADKLGSGLSEVDNFDSFECRGRNRVKGAQLSEHGKANALDVRGVKLASGRFISLTDRAESREVREQVLQSVCKRFSTVLGPGSDWYHEDHIHLDLAERRSGYRICQWNVYDPLPPVAPLLPAERPEDAPPREVAEGHPQAAQPHTQREAPAQQEVPTQQPPAQQQQAEPQAAESEATAPAPAAPAAKSKASTKAAKAAAKSKASKSRSPGTAAAPTPTESAPPQPETSEPAASESAAQPGTSAQPAEPTTPQPEAAAPTESKPATKPPPAKKKRKRRQQPNFFGLPLPKF